MPGQQERGHLVADLGVGQRPAVLVARLEQHLEQVTGCLPGPAARPADRHQPGGPGSHRMGRRVATTATRYLAVIARPT